MICSRRVLLFLVLHSVLEQISGAVLPNRSRTKREVDRELFAHLSDPSDVSVGDAGGTRRDGGTLPSQLENASAPTTHVPVRNQHQNQNLHNRRANENRLKVARLDPIGRFPIPTFRKRKEKTAIYRED